MRQNMINDVTQNDNEAGLSNSESPSKRKRIRKSANQKFRTTMASASISSNSPATFKKLYGKFTNAVKTKTSLKTQAQRKRTISDSEIEIVEMPSIVVDLDDSLNMPDPKESSTASCSKPEQINNISAGKPLNQVNSADVQPIRNCLEHEKPTAVEISNAYSDIQELASDLNVCLKDLDFSINEDANDTLRAPEENSSPELIPTPLLVSGVVASPPSEFSNENKETLIDGAISSEPHEETHSKRLTYSGVVRSSETITASSKVFGIPSNAQLFFADNVGSSNSQYPVSVPMYDTISDDSFICDKTLTPKSTKTSHVAIKVDTIDLTDNNSVKTQKMPMPLVLRGRKRLSENLDDSVVFVSETLNEQPSSCLNFISIGNNKRKNVNNLKRLKQKKIKPVQHPQTHQRNIVHPVVAPAPFPASVNNSYNPSKLDTSKAAKRMIIIDGSNVAFGHSINKQFSVRGIVICLDFFEREGHVVKAVVPQMRLKQRMSTDSDLLDKLHQSGKLVLTPCKNLPGKNSVSYDDRFILDLAVEFDAAIISNDNYRDILFENPTKYRSVIESRVVGYTWCMDMILFPKDPYGRDGPSLEQILNRVVPS